MYDHHYYGYGALAKKMFELRVTEIKELLTALCANHIKNGVSVDTLLRQGERMTRVVPLLDFPRGLEFGYPKPEDARVLYVFRWVTRNLSWSTPSYKAHELREMIGCVSDMENLDAFEAAWNDLSKNRASLRWSNSSLNS
jgi:hypothetical protein